MTFKCAVIEVKYTIGEGLGSTGKRWGTQKPGVIVHAYHPRTAEVGQADLEQETKSQKTKQIGAVRMTPKVDLWP